MISNIASHCIYIQMLNARSNKLNDVICNKNNRKIQNRNATFFFDFGIPDSGRCEQASSRCRDIRYSAIWTIDHFFDRPLSSLHSYTRSTAPKKNSINGRRQHYLFKSRRKRLDKGAARCASLLCISAISAHKPILLFKINKCTNSKQVKQ